MRAAGTVFSRVMKMPDNRVSLTAVPSNSSKASGAIRLSRDHVSLIVAPLKKQRVIYLQKMSDESFPSSSSVDDGDNESA